MAMAIQLIVVGCLWVFLAYAGKGLVKDLIKSFKEMDV